MSTFLGNRSFPCTSSTILRLECTPLTHLSPILLSILRVPLLGVEIDPAGALTITVSEPEHAVLRVPIRPNSPAAERVRGLLTCRAARRDILLVAGLYRTLRPRWVLPALAMAAPAGWCLTDQGAMVLNRRGAFLALVEADGTVTRARLLKQKPTGIGKPYCGLDPRFLHHVDQRDALGLASLRALLVLIAALGAEPIVASLAVAGARDVWRLAPAKIRQGEDYLRDIAGWLP
jgi:hypothetical protein